MTFLLLVSHTDKKSAVSNGHMMNSSLPLVVMIISLWFGKTNDLVIQSTNSLNTKLQSKLWPGHLTKVVYLQVVVEQLIDALNSGTLIRVL